METGFYVMSNQEYHSDREAISSSGLRYLLRSPAHYQAYLDEKRETTKAMNFGTAFHTSILEPEEFTKTVVVAPDCDKRTKNGKELFSAFETESVGKTIISLEESRIIRDMSTAIMGHEEAISLLSSGPSELSGFWKDGRGFMCKIRPDKLPGNGICVDLKTTDDASLEGFSKACANYGYHIQAAFYLEGLTRITGEDHNTFVFIAVEKKAPFGIGVYYASHDFLNKGRESMNKALDTYSECLKTNSWPCYGTDARELNLPRWAA